MPYSIPFRASSRAPAGSRCRTSAAASDRARDEEVAGLVDEDQEAEPEDRDEDVHATGSPARPSRRACRVRLDQLVEVAGRRAVDGVERLLDDLGDPEERQPAVEERGDGDLVRGVVGARDTFRRARRLAARARAAGTSRGRARANSSVSPPARSSGGTGVAARSG